MCMTLQATCASGPHRPDTAHPECFKTRPWQQFRRQMGTIHTADTPWTNMYDALSESPSIPGIAPGPTKILAPYPTGRHIQSHWLERSRHGSDSARHTWTSPDLSSCNTHVFCRKWLASGRNRGRYRCFRAALNYPWMGADQRCFAKAMWRVARALRSSLECDPSAGSTSKSQR